MDAQSIHETLSAWADAPVAVIISGGSVIAIYNGNPAVIGKVIDDVVEVVGARTWGDMWRMSGDIAAKIGFKRPSVIYPSHGNLFQVTHVKTKFVFRDGQKITWYGNGIKECLGGDCLCQERPHPRSRTYTGARYGPYMLHCINDEWVEASWIINNAVVDKPKWEAFLVETRTPPRWLGKYPYAFPAMIMHPNGQIVTYDHDYEIPRDICGIFPGSNPVKWAVEEGLHFAPESVFAKECIKYREHCENERRREALVKNIDEPVVINGYTLKLPENAISAIWAAVRKAVPFRFYVYSYESKIQWA